MTTGFRGPRYSELLQEFEPRPIHSEQQAERIEGLIDHFIDKPGVLSEDERDFLDLLGNLLAAWEADKYPLPSVPPLDMLRSLIEDNGLRQRDLVGPVFPTEPIASEVLHGKRKLTYDFVERLAAFFHVPPSVFFS
jgi:HTH-type transcriptional regulator / antitoxin HigA